MKAVGRYCAEAGRERRNWKKRKGRLRDPWTGKEKPYEIFSSPCTSFVSTAGALQAGPSLRTCGPPATAITSSAVSLRTSATSSSCSSCWSFIVCILLTGRLAVNNLRSTGDGDDLSHAHFGNLGRVFHLDFLLREYGYSWLGSLGCRQILPPAGDSDVQGKLEQGDGEFFFRLRQPRRCLVRPRHDL